MTTAAMFTPQVGMASACVSFVTESIDFDAVFFFRRTRRESLVVPQEAFALFNRVGNYRRRRRRRHYPRGMVSTVSKSLRVQRCRGFVCEKYYGQEIRVPGAGAHRSKLHGQPP